MAGNGLFIVLEGLDGSGKTTQIELLRQRLTKTGRRCEVTREPTDGLIGKLIRNILSGEVKAEPETLALLFASDRFEHTCEIAKLLSKGVSVLCDRYYYSSIAYQGMTLGHEHVMALNSGAMAKIKPDLVVFIDASPEECAKRMANRSERELFDALPTQKRVRESFHKTFHLMKDKEKIVIVPSCDSAEQTSDAIWETVETIINHLNPQV